MSPVEVGLRALRDWHRQPQRYVPAFVLINPHVNPACVELCERNGVPWLPTSLIWANEQQRAFIAEYHLFEGESDGSQPAPANP